LNERYEPALRGSGICKIQSGRFDDAVGELERATVADGTNAMTYLFLGVAHASLDHRDSARRALEKALSLDAAGAARARVHLANLALKENRLQDAAAQLDAYLAAVPNAPDADKLRAVRAEIASRLAK
jgi:Flp pilus assembly protein TadD